MKSKLNSFLNFLGLALIALSIPISIYILKSGNLDFTIEAFLSEEPQNVKVTNFTETSFEISWYTEKPVTGMVKLIDSIEPIVETIETKYHYIKLNNLNRNTTYSFQLLSNGSLFEPIYSGRTYLEDINKVSKWITGQVFSIDGLTAQKGGLIYLKFISNIESETIATQINDMGGFKVNLMGLRNINGEYFNINDNVMVEISVFTDPSIDSVIKKYNINLAYESQIPNIYLAEPNIDVIPGIEGN